jgi:hypothetical protein
MRKARSQPLGAARFRAIQVLDELKIYEAGIAVHRHEARVLEEERLAYLREEQAAARSLAMRVSSLGRRERMAVDRMTEEQKASWRWERRVVSWLTGEDTEGW